VRGVVVRGFAAFGAECLWLSGIFVKEVLRLCLLAA